MTDPNNKPKKFPAKGVALLGGALLIVVLIIVGGNSMLKKSMPQPLPEVAGASAPATPTGSTPAVTQDGVLPTPQTTAANNTASAPASTPAH